MQAQLVLSPRTRAFLEQVVSAGWEVGVRLAVMAHLSHHGAALCGAPPPKSGSLPGGTVAVAASGLTSSPRPSRRQSACIPEFPSEDGRLPLHPSLCPGGCPALFILIWVALTGWDWSGPAPWLL